MSWPSMPQYWTLMRTSVGPGGGISTFRISSFSGPPCSGSTTALMVLRCRLIPPSSSRSPHHRSRCARILGYDIPEVMKTPLSDRFTRDRQLLPGIYLPLLRTPWGPRWRRSVQGPEGRQIPCSGCPPRGHGTDAAASVYLARLLSQELAPLSLLAASAHRTGRCHPRAGRRRATTKDGGFPHPVLRTLQRTPAYSAHQARTSRPPAPKSNRTASFGAAWPCAS